MEETHYSTNEELQATVHELEEYQETVTDLATENQRLGEEKQVTAQVCDFSTINFFMCWEARMHSL